jgi:hypothetical protein
MRNYWIRIAIGALGIFAIGMVLVTGFRSAKTKLRATLDSTDPIPLPIAFLPFKFDGRSLGSLHRVLLTRSAPDQINGVEVNVSLHDSLTSARFKDCRLTVKDIKNLNDKTSFTCVAGDSAEQGLVPFGFVRFGDSPDSTPLLLPADAVEGLRKMRFKMDQHGFSIRDISDSTRQVQESLQQVQDSIQQAIEDRADSISEAASARADSITTAAEALADSVRRGLKESKAKPARKP